MATVEINKRSLREQVYAYFCEMMKSGRLAAGKYINQTEICNELDISKAPLRDALIQLETEGFVSILPRRGVLINSLSLKEIEDAYHILGALEGTALEQVFPYLDDTHVRKMESLNEKLLDRLKKGAFAEYYQLNNALHNVFVDLADNCFLKSMITPLKQRLYDFPLRVYHVDWERENLHEHQRLIDSIKKKNLGAAVDILKYEHWSFELHKESIKEFYKL